MLVLVTKHNFCSDSWLQTSQKKIIFVSDHTPAESDPTWTQNSQKHINIQGTLILILNMGPLHHIFLKLKFLFIICGHHDFFQTLESVIFIQEFTSQFPLTFQQGFLRYNAYKWATTTIFGGNYFSHIFCISGGKGDNMGCSRHLPVSFTTENNNCFLLRVSCMLALWKIIP